VNAALDNELLIVDVYDWDIASRDDLIGQARIPLNGVLEEVRIFIPSFGLWSHSRLIRLLLKINLSYILFFIYKISCCAGISVHWPCA
jgi:Ca2+-dependent lipid-binding protein